METKQYTITCYTENHIGLLNHVTIIFTRRKVNIESLTVSESQIKGIHSFTIVVNTSKDKAEKITKQIEKLVDVVKAFYFSEDEVISQELALYKMPSYAVEKGVEMGRFIRNNNARILDMHKDYYVIEKTGTIQETQELLEKLRPFGLLEFVRSGKVVVTKPMKALTEYLEEKEGSHYKTRE